MHSIIKFYTKGQLICIDKCVCCGALLKIIALDTINRVQFKCVHTYGNNIDAIIVAIKIEFNS